jgi:hypothetical protein
MVGGGLTEDQDLAGGGAVGLLIAFLYILGSALSIAVPRASIIIIFSIAALLGFGVGVRQNFQT